MLVAVGAVSLLFPEVIPVAGPLVFDKTAALVPGRPSEGSQILAHVKRIPLRLCVSYRCGSVPLSPHISKATACRQRGVRVERPQSLWRRKWRLQIWGCKAVSPPHIWTGERHNTGITATRRESRHAGRSRFTAACRAFRLPGNFTSFSSQSDSCQCDGSYPGHSESDSGSLYFCCTPPLGVFQPAWPAHSRVERARPQRQQGGAT